jgi:hypothetical protein
LDRSWLGFEGVKDLVAILPIRDADGIGQVDALTQGEVDAKGFLGQGPYQVKANGREFLFELKEFTKLVSVHLFEQVHDFASWF